MTTGVLGYTGHSHFAHFSFSSGSSPSLDASQRADCEQRSTRHSASLGAWTLACWRVGPYWTPSLFPHFCIGSAFSFSPHCSLRCVIREVPANLSVSGVWVAAGVLDCTGRSIFSPVYAPSLPHLPLSIRHDEQSVDREVPVTLPWRGGAADSGVG